MMSEDVATITTDTEHKRVTNEDLLAAIRALDISRDERPSTARMNVDAGTKRYEVLQVIGHDGPLSHEEIATRIQKSATGTIRRLFDGFLIDKTDAGRYTINDLGQAALNGGNQTLDDIDSDESDDDPDADPWDDTPLNRGQFTVLQAIADESEHPRTVDLIDAYADAGFEASSSAVSARLKDLFDQDFVGRTPARPYRYWITDDGDDLLNE
jgi:Fe2+ or Zn2+ uptake regulation protein